jgi:hypothetical protein
MRENRDRWKNLGEKIITEQDANNLVDLVIQVDELLALEQNIRTPTACISGPAESN